MYFFIKGNISNSNYICCNGNGSPSSPSPSTCSNSLQSVRSFNFSIFSMEIDCVNDLLVDFNNLLFQSSWYTKLHCCFWNNKWSDKYCSKANIIRAFCKGTKTSRIMNRTFTKIFSFKFGPSASSSSRSGNPGYIPGAPLIAGNAVGNTIK